jgi:hypothetical protein
MVTADLLSRARAGDGEAFRELAESHRRELQVHCYRMLGSLQDAEDAVQETMLAAWQGIGGFTEERASLPTWLPPFGVPPTRRPRITEVEPPSVTSAASRSTACHRRYSSSPLRAPV